MPAVMTSVQDSAGEIKPDSSPDARLIQKQNDCHVFERAFSKRVSEWSVALPSDFNG